MNPALFLFCVAAQLLLLGKSTATTTLNCTTVSATLPNSSALVEATCTNVTLLDVTASGNAAVVNISVALLVQRNPTAATITITAWNVTLQKGAVLLIDSTDAMDSSAAGRSSYPAVSIVIKQLVSINGAVVFKGTFPPSTTILVSEASMASNSSALAPKLPFLDSRGLQDQIKMLWLFNLGLVNASSFILDRSHISAPSAASSIPLYVTDNITVVRSSSLVFMNSSFTVSASYSAAIRIYFASLTILSHSVLAFVSCNVSTGYIFSIPFFVSESQAMVSLYSEWSFLSCNLKSLNASTFSIAGSPITITNFSSWHVASSNFSTMEQQAFVVSSSSLIFITCNSSWYYVRCNFSSAHYYAFHIDTTRVEIVSGSSWYFDSCNFSSQKQATFKLSAAPVWVALWSAWYHVLHVCAASGDAAYLISSSVQLSYNSTWSMTNCTLGGALAGLSVSQTQIELHAQSLWKIESCNFQGSFAALDFLSGSLDVRNDSEWVLTQSVLFSPGIGALVFTTNLANFSAPRSTVTVEQSSRWSMSWNTLSSTGSGSALVLGFADFLITAGSSWSVDACTASTTYGTGASFLLSSATLRVSMSSEFVLTRSSFAASVSAAAMSIKDSKITIADMSLWEMTNMTLVGQTALIATASSTTSQIVVVGSSAWVLRELRLLSSRTGGAVVLSCRVIVSAASLFLLQGCTLGVQSPTCLTISDMTALDWGLVRILENHCETAGGATFSASTIAVEVMAAFPQVVERCNEVDGVLAENSIGGATSLPCGRCDLSVDCFWPLTAVDQTGFTKMHCDNACSCAAACGGMGSSCLPGPGTFEAVCKENNNYNRRIQTTRTTSMSPTRSATLTRIMTPILGEGATVAVQHSKDLHNAVVAVVSVAIVFSGASGASMLQKMMAQQRLNSCGTDTGGALDFMSSPTQMQVGPDTEDGGSYVRGSVVGNALLWLACLGAAGALAKVFHKRGITSGLRESGTELGLPGRLYVPYSFLMVPTIASSVALVAAPGRGATVGDVVLGVFGVCVCVGGAAVIGYMTASSSMFLAVGVRSREEPFTSKTRVQRLARQLLASHCEWVDRKSRRAAGFVARWGALFGAYRSERQWFCVAETLSGMVGGVLAGLAVSDKGDGAVCAGLEVAAIVANVAFVGAIMLLRPYGAIADFRLAFSNAALTAVGSLLGALDFDTTMLTAVQGFLNGVGVLVFVAALAVDGFFDTAWKRLIELLRMMRAKQRSRKLALTNSSARAATPESLLLILRSKESEQQKRARLLEEIVRLICEGAAAPTH